MIGIFFTDEPVINYDAAKSSNLQFFAAYYREMVEQGYFTAISIRRFILIDST